MLISIHVKPQVCLNLSDIVALTMAFVRTPLQDWAELSHYMSAGMWETQSSPSIQQSQKLNMLLSHFVALGLRWPSEPTIRVLASVYILCAEDHSQALNMSPQMKYEIFRAVKTALKSQIDKSGQPAMVCVRLPSDPASFRTDFKPLWDAAFGPDSSGVPVPSQVPYVDLHRVMVNMPMRSSNFSSRENAAVQRSFHQTEHSPQASQVMQQLQQQMNQFQSFTMAAIQHFGAGHLHQGVLPRPGIQLQFPSVLPLPGAINALALPDPANQPRTIQRLNSRLEAATAQPVAETQPLALIESQPQSQDQLVVHEQSEQIGSQATTALPNKKSVSQVAASIQNSFDELALEKKKKKKKGKKVKKGKEGKKPTKEVKQKQPKAPKEAPKEPAPEKPQPALQQKRPSVGHETSRSQYMGRTGLPGIGQTKAFKYTDKKGSREKAKKESDSWLAEQMETRGFK